MDVRYVRRIEFVVDSRQGGFASVEQIRRRGYEAGV